jgi:hypothetical protein
MWIRTTTSVFAAMALAGTVAGQTPMAWQGSPRGPSLLPAFQAAPLSGAHQNEEPRTIYYKKDTNRTGVTLAAAADLAAPLVVAQQPARPGDMPPATQGRQMPPDSPTPYLDPEVADPRRKAGDGVEPLFRLDNEQQFVARENTKRDASKQIVFPKYPLSTEPATNRPFPALQMLIEPNFVCHGRLYFEDKNCERYGWSMGPLQPLYSSIQFLSGLSSLPYNFFSFPRLWYDCSAGQCLPGDPVPYLLYPPGLSLTGALGSVGVNSALAAVLP